MRYNFLLILFLSTGYQKLFSQNVISQLAKQGNEKPRNVSCNAVGDRILLGYEVLSADRTSWRFVSNIILPGGGLKKIDLVKDEFNSIIGTIQIDSERGRIFFIVDNKNKSELRSLEINLNTGAKTYSQGQFEILDRVIGGTVENQNLILYSIKKDNGRSLRVTKFNDQIVSDTYYELPIDLSSLRESETAFIPPSPFVSIIQSLERVKFMPSMEALDIVIDDAKTDPKDKKKGTLIVHVDTKTKVVETKFIYEPATLNNPWLKYRSYLCNQYLFRTVIDKLFILKVFDRTSGELLYNESVKKDESSKDKFTTNRYDNEPPFIGGNIAGLAYRGNIPFVIASRDSSSGKFSLVCGSNRNPKYAVPIGLSPAALITAAVSNAVRQLSDSPGQSRYFHCSGDFKSGFKSFTEDPQNGIRQKIDSFEMTFKPGKTKTRYKNLSFCLFKKGVIGAYHDRTDKVIKLVEFTR